VAEDGGLSLSELAEQRGISNDAARRLVKAGKVPAHQVTSDHGPTWCCHPDGEIPERNGSASPAPGLHQGAATVAPESRNGGAGGAQPQDVAALVALVDRLTTEKAELVEDNRELTRTVAAWQSQAIVLAGWLTDAQERLALNAPVAPQQPQASSGAPDQPAPTTDAPVPPSARLLAWWPALLAALAIVAVVALLAWPR
jgi:hypothetical protein